MKTLFAFILISFAAMTSFAETQSAGLVPLLGVMTSPYGISIQAHSGGCTAKDSFIAKKERTGAITRITFLRVKEDPCLALYTYGVVLTYSFEELGLQDDEKFIIRNPLTFSKVL